MAQSLIESDLPAHWRDLQEAVARILNECGPEAKVEETIETVRGQVEIDVLAIDPGATFDRHVKGSALKDASREATERGFAKTVIEEELSRVGV